MPFTPLHLGPGLAIKAVAGQRLSFMVFGGAQVLIDIEPLLGLLGLIDSLHGITHTLPGALLIGALATVSGRPIGNLALRLAGWHGPAISWASAAAGAFIGTFSHLVLDGVMHGDIAPLWPLTTLNPWRGVLSWQALHSSCLLLGLAGGGLALWRSRRHWRGG